MPVFHGSMTMALTHWGRVTHICVGNLTIIGSDNGLSPDRRQAITWTNAGILIIGPLETNSSEISIKIQTCSFTKMHLKTSSAKRRPSCFSLNVLMSVPPLRSPPSPSASAATAICFPIALHKSQSCTNFFYVLCTYNDMIFYSWSKT